MSQYAGPETTHEPPYGRPEPESPRKQPRGRAALAGVLAISLLAGGGAGVAGAAAWDSWHSDGQGSSAGVSSSSAQGTPASVASDESAAGAGATPSSLDIEAVAAEVLPSVVRIDVSGSQGTGAGSGIILSKDGRILTNNHVISGADGGSIRVSFNDGSHADATVVGTDPLTDVAVIQAEGVSGLTPADIGKSAGLKVGQPVVAVGSPYGLDATVTSGIVSALDRPVSVGSDAQGNVTAYPAVQTDAAINPGNSGGPLVDGQGRVIGINSSIRSTSNMTGQAGSIGLGFAIPIDEVMPIVDQIVAGETPTHARLGVTVGGQAPEGGMMMPGQPGQEQATESPEGAQLRSVSDGSAAAEAGLRAGDVITAVDDRQIADSEALIAIIRSYRPDTKVTVTYTRDGQEQTADVTLGSDAGRTAS